MVSSEPGLCCTLDSPRTTLGPALHKWSNLSLGLGDGHWQEWKASLADDLALHGATLNLKAI